jgi:hypothetical protein
MRHFAFSTCFAAAWAFTAALVSPSAHADSFTVPYAGPGADPAESFEADCLGDTVAEDCETRAGAMESELFSLLVTLESDDAAETVALFREVLELDAPLLQVLAVEYLSRTAQEPTDFLDKVEAFFFGTDPKLAAVAADTLSFTDDETSAELSARFREQRSSSNYAPFLVEGESDIEEPLLAASLSDARVNAMDSFTEDEQFQPAERLLMYDRFVYDFQETSVDYPVTSYVTDASVDDVVAHFSELFGKDPYPPSLETQIEVQAVSAEMAQAQLDALDGDRDAIAKLQELGDRLLELNDSLVAASRLQLDGMYAERDVYWVDGDAAVDNTGPLPRAVTVGRDELLGRTVIRYVHGAIPGSTGEPGSDAGAPNGPSEEDPSDEDPSEDDDESPSDAERPPEDDDSGCHVSPTSSLGPSATGLLGVALLLWGRRGRAARSTQQRSGAR